MLSTARVALPATIEIRLKTASEFVDNVMEFAREDLIGFRRPLAATFAFTTPAILALAYYSAGVPALLETAAAVFAIAGAGLVVVGRQLWPGLVEDYHAGANKKRKAVADLKCGFGEAAFLNLECAPRFFEYANGALALADAGDFRTLFFSVSNGPEDPRWAPYRDGEMNRRVWRWLRLPVSGEVVKFSAEGSKHAALAEPSAIESIDAWEAINTALGEPMDGAIIHRPFAEIVEMIERLV